MGKNPLLVTSTGILFPQLKKDFDFNHSIKMSIVGKQDKKKKKSRFYYILLIQAKHTLYLKKAFEIQMLTNKHMDNISDLIIYVQLKYIKCKS